jgi:hypothetical protein
MALQCSKCAKKIGTLDNHGNSNAPLCFECANSKVECMSCKKIVPIKEIVTDEGNNICKNCHEIKINEANLAMNNSSSVNKEDTIKNQMPSISQPSANGIVITDIKMSFSSMVSFLIKIAFASIPALIVVTLTVSVILILILTLFGISLSHILTK